MNTVQTPPVQESSSQETYQMPTEPRQFNQMAQKVYQLIEKKLAIAADKRGIS